LPLPVVSGATIMCSFGTAPSSLTVLPAKRLMVAGMPAATIMDNIPMVNILPFAMCLSLANPMVASATAAAAGVLTPQPCIPVTPAPWVPGSPTATAGGVPLLNNTSTCNCMWAGIITVVYGGVATATVP
jgi:hypothetical protein